MDRAVQHGGSARRRLPLAGKPARDEQGRPPSRQERRQERRRRERQRIAKHGASLRRVYRDAVSRRARADRQKD